MNKLNQSWENCLTMWKWVSGNLPRGFAKLNRTDKLDVINKLKRKWLIANGFEGNRVLQDCFFCEFSSIDGDILCGRCPGRLADRDFHCNRCADSISWILNPKNFYKNLVKLDKNREGK